MGGWGWMLSVVITIAAANISLKGKFSPQFLLGCDAPAGFCTLPQRCHPFLQAERGSVAHCEVCSVCMRCCPVYVTDTSSFSKALDRKFIAFIAAMCALLRSTPFHMVL